MFIFLDFDGVLCTDRTYKAWRSVGSPKDFASYVSLFDSDCVQQLNQLEGCSIIVSSSWRYSSIQPYPCVDLLRDAGVNLPIVGETPKLTPYHNYAARGKEIAAFVEEHGLSLTDFIILDDEAHAARFGIKGQGSRLIQTPESTGFSHPRFLERAKKLIGG